MKKGHSVLNIVLILIGFFLPHAYGLEKISSLEELQDHINQITKKANTLAERPIKGRDILPRCQKGDEYQLGACYRSCDKDSTGIGPICWKKCQAGFKDLGVSCYKKGRTQKKKSYARGLGTKPICSKSQEKFGLL